MIHLSETKYCSVGAMISKTAKIETTFEILPDDARKRLPRLPKGFKRRAA